MPGGVTKDLSSESDVKKQQYNPTKQSPLQIKLLFLIQERMNKKEDCVKFTWIWHHFNDIWLRWQTLEKSVTVL